MKQTLNNDQHGQWCEGMLIIQSTANCGGEKGCQSFGETWPSHSSSFWVGTWLLQAVVKCGLRRRTVKSFGVTHCHPPRAAPNRPGNKNPCHPKQITQNAHQPNTYTTGPTNHTDWPTEAHYPGQSWQPDSAKVLLESHPRGALNHKEALLTIKYMERHVLSKPDLHLSCHQRHNFGLKVERYQIFSSFPLATFN